MKYAKAISIIAVISGFSAISGVGHCSDYDALPDDWKAAVSEANAAYVTCIYGKARDYTSQSSEPADTIARAAIGSCRSEASEIESLMRLQIDDTSRVRATMATLESRLEKELLGFVIEQRMAGQ